MKMANSNEKARTWKHDWPNSITWIPLMYITLLPCAFNIHTFTTLRNIYTYGYQFATSIIIILIASSIF